MPAPSVGGLPPGEEVGLPLEGGPGPRSGAAGLPEGEAGLPGEETEAGGADHACEGGLDRGVVADAGAEAK